MLYHKYRKQTRIDQQGGTQRARYIRVNVPGKKFPPSDKKCEPGKPANTNYIGNQTIDKKLESDS